jgi:hypothetical protein
MKQTVMQALADIAAGCATQEKPFGAYIRTKYFAGGFAFRTDAEAAQWINEQYLRAMAQGDRSDFKAAAATLSGQAFTLFS